MLRTFWLGLGLAACLTAAAEQPPTAEAILERAIAAAAEADDRKLTYRFRHVYDKQTEGDDDVRDVYQVEPVDGEHFYRLVERNGEPATEEQLAEEAKLRAKFRDKMRSGDDQERGKTGFELDEDLLGRYRFELLGVEDVDGRAAWALRFEPRSEDLPINRRADYALNALTGVMYIDKEDYGLTRADFELGAPVKVWAGVLGALHQFEGRLDLKRLEPGVWAPEAMHLDCRGRVLVSSTQQTVKLLWSEYRRIGESD